MTKEERIEKEIEISRIKTVKELLEWLEDDLANAQRNELINEDIFEMYYHALIGQYEEDNCSELANNIIECPLKIELWQRYEDDLFKAETFLNKNRIETRYGKKDDAFRPMSQICDDIAKVYKGEA